MNLKNVSISLLAVATLGCGQPAATTTPAPAPTTAATTTAAPLATPTSTPVATASPAAEAPIEREALIALLDQRNVRFPYKETKRKENGPVLLAIATDSGDPKQIIAALKPLRSLYTHNAEVTRRNLAGDDYRAAIKKHLKSEDPKIRHWAINASEPTLGKTPDPEVVAILVDFMQNAEEVGARHDAIDVINSMGDYHKDPVVSAALLKALEDPEPAVASKAAFRLVHRSHGLEDKKKFFAVSRKMMEHKDPGLRGRGAQLSGKLAAEADKEELSQRLMEMLKDENPFVRSKAADALAKLKRTDAVAKMLPLLEDKTKNTYDIQFTNLLGKKDRVHHDGSPWSRVDDATLHALEWISSPLREDKFKYGKVKSKTIDDDIAREAGLAKEWYKKNKDKL